MQAKVDIMQHRVKMFIELFTQVFKKGLPFFWEEGGKLLSQVDYHAQLVRCKLENKKFEYMHQSLSGKTVVETLFEDFENFYTCRATCAQLP